MLLRRLIKRVSSGSKTLTPSRLRTPSKPIITHCIRLSHSSFIYRYTINSSRIVNRNCLRHISKRYSTVKNAPSVIKKKSKLRKILKYIFVSTAAVVLISSVVTAYLYKTDEGIARSLYFTYKSMYPFYQYYRAQTPEQKTALDVKYAPYFLTLILELGGYYVKISQTLCGMNVLPDEYEKTFDILLDKIPQKEFALIESIICKELKISSTDEIFEWIEAECIGAGSIGQVHRAALKEQYALDNNITIRDVVIKVQYPNVESYFNMDIMTCKYWTLLTGGLDPNTISDVFDKAYEAIELEFHYDVEAKNLIQCDKNLPDHLRPYIKIPQVVTSLCTKEVLVMEFITGERMSDRMNSLMKIYAKSVNKTLEELKKEWKVTDLDAMKNMDEPVASENMLQFYRYGLYTKDLFFNWLKWFANVLFGSSYAYEWEYKIVLNGPKLTRILFEVFGKAILLDGFFNSDPHAGNILMRDYDAWFPIAQDIDLALIDFGNVQTLDKKQRIGIAKLIVSMAEYNLLKEGEDDQEALNKIAASCVECGMESTKNDVDFLASQVLMGFDMRFDTELLDRFDIPHNILYMQKRFNEMDDWKIFPAAFFNLQRCLQLLVQASAQAGSGTPIPSLLWKDIAQKVLDDHNNSS